MNRLIKQGKNMLFERVDMLRDYTADGRNAYFILGSKSNRSVIM